MTREEAINEINKVFTSAYANYIVIALTEGATVSDKEPTTKNDLGVDWESYKDADGNSLDDLILDVIQRNFDCGNTYGYKVADEIIGLLPSATPQEPKWIPVKTRKLTDAEEQYMLENSDYYYGYMFDCRLPEDGEEVLVTTSTGEVTTTTFYDEGLNGCYFEFYEDDGDVIAWMPLPQPYKAESEGE